MRLLRSRRGEADFGLEEFVRLVMSFAIAVIMLGFVIFIVLMITGNKVDRTAENSLDNLVWLIEAQKDNSWEAATYVPLAAEFVLVGFSADVPRVSVFARPNICQGDCLCIFEADYDKIEENRMIVCKKIPFSLTGETDSEFPAAETMKGFAKRQNFRKCMLLQLKKTGDSLDIRSHPSCEGIDESINKREEELAEADRIRMRRGH